MATRSRPSRGKSQPPPQSSSPSSSDSLDSFPSLSSFSLADDDQRDELVVPAEWKRPALYPSDSDSEDALPFDHHSDSQWLDDDDDTTVDDPGYATSDSGDGADDETPHSPPPRRRSSTHRAASTRVTSLKSTAIQPALTTSRTPVSPRTANTIVTPQQATTAADTQRRQHFTACFVRVDPPLLRSLVHLELSSSNVKRTELQTLASHLFLLSSLHSLNLSDNQLDDSCAKDLRAVISLEGLHHIDLSRNLLGRGVARMLADRLKHRLALRSLHVAGNRWFFAYDDAADVARSLAQAVAANASLVEFSISLPQPQPQLEYDRFVVPPVAPSSPRKRSSAASIDTVSACPAEAFTRELVTAYAATTRPPSLHALGLVHAELSRRAIVNLMKLASGLVALDLSFAFAGISAAQVVATALKMKQYATLTQLNLRGNRLKSMGARAILRALHVNDRLTDVDLSRNQLRSDVVADVAAMLAVNRTIVRLDITHNDTLFAGGGEQRKSVWQAVEAAIGRHHALLSLGDLRSLQCSEGQRETLKRLLLGNQQRQDDLVQRAVQQSMESDRPGAGTQTQTTTFPPSDRSEKAVWRQRTAVKRQALVSFMWKVKAFAVASKSTASTNQRDGTGGSVGWRVLVLRQCDMAGSVELEAATGSVAVAASSAESSFALCCATVHCEDGDVLSLTMTPAQDEDGDSNTIKVLIKDTVVLPRSMASDCVVHRFDCGDGPPQLLVWQPKSIRRPLMDPHTHTAELLAVYIQRTGWYRLVWRVRCSVASQLKEILEKALNWTIARSHCWDEGNRDVLVEGSSQVFHAVVRSGCDVVLSSEPMEFITGEVIALSAATASPHATLHLVQSFVLQDAA